MRVPRGARAFRETDLTTSELTQAELLGLRQRALALTGERPGPSGVADRLLALQGQDLPGALWSLGLRSGSTIADVRASFDRGGLVRIAAGEHLVGKINK